MNIANKIGNTKLLDIRIKINSDYPIIEFIYFNEKDRTEIIETYMSSICTIEQDYDFESSKYNLFDIIFKCRDLSLISKEVNKL